MASCDLTATLSNNPNSLSASLSNDSQNLTIKSDIGSGSRLDSLTDVNVSLTSANGSILVYDSSSDTYVQRDIISYDDSTSTYVVDAGDDITLKIKVVQSGEVTGLANGEIGYSYSSNKFYIGQTDTATSAVTTEVIGGAYLVNKVANLESQFISGSNTGVSSVAFTAANNNLRITTNGGVSHDVQIDVTDKATWTALLATNTAIDTRLLAIESPDKNLYANNLFVETALTVNGDIVLRGSSLTFGDGGDVININATVNNHIIPTSNVTYDLGNAQKSWGTVYASSFEGDGSSLTGLNANNIQMGATCTAVGNSGAVTNITTDTTVCDALARINQALFNVQQSTFIRSVDFTSTPVQGGEGTTVTLSTTLVGEADRLNINWGDGSWTNATSDFTPSHTYTSNENSPYTVTVYAYNVGAVGAGSNSSFSRSDYITIYTADPAVDFGIYNQLSGGSELATYEANNNQAIYLDNDTANIANTGVTATFSINWGDGNLEQITGKTEAGGSQGARKAHTYTSGSGSSRFTITVNCNSTSTATPGIFPISNTALLKVFDLGIAAPDNLSSKTISWASSSSGTSPKLAAGFDDNATGKSAGDSISSSFPRFTSGTKTTGSMSTFFHTTGSVSQLVNDSSTGTPITDASGQDYYNLNASGSSVSAASRIYAPALYTTGTKARVSYDIGSGSVGVNKVELSTTEGNSNELFYVYDDVTASPTIDVSGATVAHGSGTYNYISGIPYYNSGDTLTISGLTATNLTGQTYYNGNPLTIGDTVVQVGSGTAIADQTKSYSDILASGDITSGIPNADLASVNFDPVTVTVGSGDGAVKLTASLRNVNGTTSTSTINSSIINVFNGEDFIDETAIPVSDDLGITYDTDAVRISGLTGATPALTSSKDYYVDNAWSNATTVNGTDEAILRLGLIEHNETDYSSGYLPVGPDLSSGRSGSQFFRFAFKRAAMSNFVLRLSGKVSGVYVAAPGTQIDDTSTLNGWMDGTLQYAGAGIPGADVVDGGNGSNGCAYTGNDRIVDGTTYTNEDFTFTLGTESSTNAYENQIIVGIVLNSDDYITSIAVEEPA